MNSVNWLLILTTAAFVSAAQLTSAQERKGSYRIEDGASNRPSEPTQVEGRWYTNGERRKPATIISSRLRGTEARNELGQFTRIEFDGNGSIRALDWAMASGAIFDAAESNGPTAQPGRASPTNRTAPASAWQEFSH
jgi:hypothetical protein